MSYALSFSPEFFFAEGEPYDRSDYAVDNRGRPTSVWSAICMLAEKDPKRWAEMANAVFELSKKHAKLLMAEAVLDKIRETNTCQNLDSPVEVYIDVDGCFSVKVWDASVGRRIIK